MLDSSKDILNILLGLSIAAIAAMMSVLLYNLIMIIRDFRNLSKSLREKMDAIDSVITSGKQVLNTIQDKLEHSSAYIGILIQLVTKIVDYLKTNKQNNSSSTNNRDN